MKRYIYELTVIQEERYQAQKVTLHLRKLEPAKKKIRINESKSMEMSNISAEVDEIASQTTEEVSRRFKMKQSLEIEN